MPPENSVLHLITKGTWGGAQKYVYEMASAAKGRGYRVLVAYGEPGELDRKLRGAGIDAYVVRSFSRDVGFLKEAKAFFDILGLIRREKPGVLHVNSSKAGVVGALAGRIARVPRIVFTAHGWAFNEDRPAWERAVLRALHRITVALAHVTVCVSESTARDIRTRRNAHKIRVIHNGISCRPSLPKDEARQALLPDATAKRWIGVVAELHPTKQIPVAIEAFAKIAGDYPDTMLIVCGEGGERDACEALIKERDLGGRAVLRGFVPDISSHLSAFDVFALPSRSEALGIALLEAGCAGLPSVGTNVGGIPEVIEDGVTGLLVPSGHASALARALRELLDEPERASALGEALKARVAKDFTLEAMAEKTFAVYGA